MAWSLIHRIFYPSSIDSRPNLYLCPPLKGSMPWYVSPNLRVKVRNRVASVYPTVRTVMVSLFYYYSHHICLSNQPVQKMLLRWVVSGFCSYRVLYYSYCWVWLAYMASIRKESFKDRAVENFTILHHKK